MPSRATPAKSPYETALELGQHLLELIECPTEESDEIIGAFGTVNKKKGGWITAAQSDLENLAAEIKADERIALKRKIADVFGPIMARRKKGSANKETVITTVNEIEIIDALLQEGYIRAKELIAERERVSIKNTIVDEPIIRTLPTP